MFLKEVLKLCRVSVLLGLRPRTILSLLGTRCMLKDISANPVHLFVNSC